MSSRATAVTARTSGGASTPRRSNKPACSATTNSSASELFDEPKQSLKSNSISLTIKTAGAAFKCSLQSEWPCERLISVAISQYKFAFSNYETPEFDVIYHCGKQLVLQNEDQIGTCCENGDEIELGVSEPYRKTRLAKLAPKCLVLQGEMMNNSPTKSQQQQPSPRAITAARIAAERAKLMRCAENLQFSVLFHRLPLGFNIRQENDRILVANIYPKSTASHYSRLLPGMTIAKIGSIRLKGHGIRQVHELIKNAKWPLEMQFKCCPNARTPLRENVSLASKLCNRPRKASFGLTPHFSRGRNKTSSVADQDEEESATFKTAVPIIYQEDGSVKSHFVKTKQSLIREKTAASETSPAGVKRTSRSKSDGATTSAQEDNHQEILLRKSQSADIGSNNQTEAESSPTPSGASASPRIAFQKKQQKASKADKKKSDINGSVNTEDSNQDEAEDDASDRCEHTEESLNKKIKDITSELMRKREEVRVLESQLAGYKEKLVKAVLARKSTNKQKGLASRGESKNMNGTPTASKARSVSNGTNGSRAKKKVQLTPEILEEIDLKSGVPKSSTRRYTCMSSNASSVSGLSNYSSQSCLTTKSLMHRKPPMGRYTSCTTKSVCSELSNPSPRKRSATTGSSRNATYPQRYSSPSASAAASASRSSFSSRGAVISRAETPRDSYIRKTEGPGVGYYDVKIQDKVKGGEIGDSDRALPWVKE